MSLKIDQKAPDFTLPSTSGGNLTLSKDLDHRACILYFYPKGFTRGCTIEACGFRDHIEIFGKLNIPILGISRDSISTHKKFKEQHRLPFDLLSDEDGEVCKAYKALIPLIRIPKRITYLLNQEHRVKAVFKDFFDSKSHITQMVRQLEN